LLDLTRTAASSATLWADILLQNADPVLRASDQVGGELASMRDAIERRDREALISLFSRAADWRRRLG
jgi:prephenate dehydrogenase